MPLPFHRSDILKILFRIEVKVCYSARCGIKAVAGAGIIKGSHCRFNLFLNTAVFLFIIEGAVFKDDILGFGDINEPGR